MQTEFSFGNLIAIENYYDGEWGLKRFNSNIALISKKGDSIYFLNQRIQSSDEIFRDLAIIIDLIQSHNKTSNS